MRGFTDQTARFSASRVEIPDIKLDILSKLIDWQSLRSQLRTLKSDHDALSLFNVSLLQTWHNLSDAGGSNILGLDLVFVKLCGFSLEGSKPNAATICRFRKNQFGEDCLETLLSTVNQNLSSKDLMLNSRETCFGRRHLDK